MAMEYFVPGILTTSRLHLLDLDPRDANSSTGEIPYKRVTLINHPYLIYEMELNFGCLKYQAGLNHG